MNTVNDYPKGVPLSLCELEDGRLHAYVAEVVTVPDHGKEDVPIVELHFYQWLQDNWQDWFLVAPTPEQSSLRCYLDSLGIELKHGVNVLCAGDLQLLRTIYDFAGYDRYVGR